jgi:hypothetical protein
VATFMRSLYLYRLAVSWGSVGELLFVLWIVEICHVPFYVLIHDVDCRCFEV